MPVEYHDHEVLKIDNLKFFQCPVSWLSPRSWELLNLVIETTNGETGEITHLPYPGSYLEQPEWYREAVKIRRGERLSKWFSELLKKQAEKDRGK